MRDRLREIDFVTVEQTPEMEALAQALIDGGVLSDKSYNDCLHIASAVMSGCGCIASWNFKHLVNYRTISGVRRVVGINGYNDIEIVSPDELPESEEDGS